MRHVFKYYSLFIFSILTLCCSVKKENTDLITVYDVSGVPEDIPLSKISSKVLPIFLKSSGGHFVRSVLQLEQNDEFIIISDGRTIFKFDIKGDFVGIIGTNGQGPGEYDYLKSIVLDWENKTIYASTFNKIIKYDLEGTFLNEKKFETMIDGMALLNGNLKILITDIGYPSRSPDKSITKNFLIGSNKNLNVTDSLLIRSIEVNKNSASTLGGDMKFVSSTQKADFLYMPVVITEPIIRDTLYRIKDSSLIPELKLDFKVNDKLEQKFLIKSMIRSSNYILTNFFMASELHQALINTPTKFYLVGKNGFQDDLYQTGKVLLQPWNLENDEFYFVKDAYEVTGLMEGMTEDDNPVLFIVKLDK